MFKSCLFRKVLVASFILTALAEPSQATTLTGFSTFGDDMAGMNITATSTLGSESAIWGVTGSGAGAALGSTFTLRQSGDTFASPWTLSYTGPGLLTSLVIQAIPGNTVFDTISFPDVTPGSALGRLFTVVSGLAPTSAVYSDPIDISQGDLFGTLTLTWANGFNGELNYLADTDSGTQDDPIQIIPEPAPLPGLVALSLVALGGFAVSKRNRQEA